MAQLYDRIVRVGNQYYYTLDRWEATKGPFDTYEQAADAMTAELQTRYGKKEITINQRTT